MQGELINRDYQKLGHLSYQEIHDSYKRIGMVISTKQMNMVAQPLGRDKNELYNYF